MNTKSDADRIRELHDIEEIKKLKSRYIDACDGGWAGRLSHDSETMVSLFTEDCVWDGGAFGYRVGREALREYYRSNDASNKALAFHLLTSPIIEVNGDQARGTWHLTILLKTVEGPSSVVAGTFDDVYHRTADGWRIHRSRFTTALTKTCGDSWQFLD